MAANRCKPLDYPAEYLIMTRKQTSPASGAAPSSRQASATPDERDAAGRFEDDLQELERIVGQMESGDLSLEKSLQLFERGVELGKRCRRSLEKAEQRVRELTPDGGEGDDGPTPDETASEHDSGRFEDGEIPF